MLQAICVPGLGTEFEDHYIRNGSGVVAGGNAKQWEKSSLPEKNTPTGCPLSNGQP